MTKDRDSGLEAARQARLAAALRDNLLKRKARARVAAPDAPPPEKP